VSALGFHAGARAGVGERLGDALGSLTFAIGGRRLVNRGQFGDLALQAIVEVTR
jgi:hypothetical protein